LLLLFYFIYSWI